MFGQRFQELNIQELKISQPTPSLKHGIGIEYSTKERTQHMETISNVSPPLLLPPSPRPLAEKAPKPASHSPS